LQTPFSRNKKSTEIKKRAAKLSTTNSMKEVLGAVTPLAASLAACGAFAGIPGNGHGVH
jgi:hypothetical protein